MRSIADLTTAVTRQQVEASIYQVLSILGVSTTSWKPGAVVRAAITAISLLLSAFSSLMAAIARSGFLELAADDWLTLVAYYVFGVSRIEATFATGELTLVNSGGLTFNLDPDDLVVSNPTTGKSYRNADAVTLNPGETLTISIIAVEAGSASTSSPGGITNMVTTLIGVTCSNATAVVGQDAESDPLLRTRCLEKLGSLSPNGPWDAYSFAARNAVRADGTTIGVTRVRVVRDGYGHVDTYVATATGAVTGDATDASTDLGAINDAIQRKAAPLAVTANTLTATPVTVPVTYQAWMYNTSGLSEAEILLAISTRLTTFMSTQPIGGNVISGVGKVFSDAIRTTIGASRPEIFHVVVSVPAADQTLNINEVPVLGTVTGTITQVAPPDGI